MDTNTLENHWTLAGTWIVGLTIGGSVKFALQLFSQSAINWF